VDEELVEAAERGVLVGGGVRGCPRVCHAAGAPYMDVYPR
jgi:hypothetical protein